MKTTPARSNALNRALIALTAFALLFQGAGPASAEDFYCEVMSVEGTATLSNATVSGKVLAEGDLVSVEDVIRVEEGGYVDLAYDKDWNNVTRIEEKSSVRIRSLNPTTVSLESGGVFAKLRSLPKDSSFDVETPTAIASVRGTEYRTTFLEGETEVYNVSDSDVYVYGVDAEGKRQAAEPIVIRNSEKTFVQRRGEAPGAPRRMEAHEMQKASQFRQGIERKVAENVGRGRTGKLPDVHAIEQRMRERRDAPAGDPNNREPRERRERMENGMPHQDRGQMAPQAQGHAPDGRRQEPNKPSQAKPGPRPRNQR